MRYIYTLKNCGLLTTDRKIQRCNLSLSGIQDEPLFDKLKLRIPLGVSVEIDSSKGTITIGDKVYHFMDGGDFTSEDGIPVTHSYMH